MEFILRKWNYDDVESLAVAANNKNIAKKLRNIFPYPYTVEDAKTYVSQCIRRDGERCILRAIEIDGKAAGSIGLFLQNDVYEKSAELGYWLSEEYWGKGVMTRAVEEICKEGFDKFDIVRIYAEPFENNVGSRKVLEKAGFVYEGTMRNGVCKNGEVFSYCVYSVLRGEIQ
ncbi:MAG: GNAT family N-acetyltransferase [Christensenellales bacterium]